jgi:hypothetical protein
VAFRGQVAQIATFFEYGTPTSIGDFTTKLGASLVAHRARLLDGRFRQVLTGLRAGVVALLAAALAISVWLRVGESGTCDSRAVARVALLGFFGLAAALSVAMLMLHHRSRVLDRERRKSSLAVLAAIAAATFARCTVAQGHGCDTEMVVITGTLVDEHGSHPPAKIHADGYDFGATTQPDGSFAGEIKRASIHHAITFRAIGSTIGMQQWTNVDLPSRIHGSTLDLGQIVVRRESEPSSR